MPGIPNRTGRWLAVHRPSQRRSSRQGRPWPGPARRGLRSRRRCNHPRRRLLHREGRSPWVRRRPRSHRLRQSSKARPPTARRTRTYEDDPGDTASSLFSRESPRIDEKRMERAARAMLTGRHLSHGSASLVRAPYKHATGRHLSGKTPTRSSRCTQSEMGRSSRWWRRWRSTSRNRTRKSTQGTRRSSSRRGDIRQSTTVDYLRRPSCRSSCRSGSRGSCSRSTRTATSSTHLRRPARLLTLPSDRGRHGRSDRGL